jgi:diadenosine tetraphosphate (Ap4A) HIT family hydrolase
VPAEELTDFRATFRLDELTVVEGDHWVVSVRPGQLTLGSMVVSSRTGLLDFVDLDAAASEELGRAFGEVERLARELLGAVRVNFVALMMKDPVIHFHALPRFDATVERYGRTWEDADWPGPPTFGPAPTEDDVLAALVGDLREASRPL